MPADIYYRSYRPVVSGLIDRCHVILGDVVGVDGVQVGWSACERTRSGDFIHHYTYVKNDYRKHGYGRRLWTAALEACGWDGRQRVMYTHHRSPFDSIAARMRWVYAPMFVTQEARDA